MRLRLVMRRAMASLVGAWRAGFIGVVTGTRAGSAGGLIGPETIACCGRRTLGRSGLKAESGRFFLVRWPIGVTGALPAAGSGSAARMP